MNSTEPRSPSTVLSTTKIYPPLLAGTLVLGTLVLHFIVPEARSVGWYQVIGLLVVALGAGLSCFAAALFQARETTRNPYGEPTALVAHAPYTWTRNPMYLGLATALMLAPVVFIAVIDRMVIPREEETLGRLFGNDYADYKNRVRRWI